MKVAVIPARGGSKRIPRKNIRDFCGRPIIAYSIEAARASGLFDTILVSTDDEEIAAIARAHGADVPFMRPADLADDHASTLPVVAHAIDWLEAHRNRVDLACCIYATAPFLDPAYLRQGCEFLLAHGDADFCFSVTSYAFPIFRALGTNPDGSVRMLWPENESRRSQDLPEAWHDAGQFYWGRPQAFRKCEGVFSARAYPVVLPRYLVQDIDTAEDWAAAERLFEAHRNGMARERTPAHPR